MYDIYPCFQRVLSKCLIICIYNTHVLFTSPESHSSDVDSAIEVNKIAMFFVLSEKMIKSSLNLNISLSCAFKHKGCKISAQADTVCLQKHTKSLVLYLHRNNVPTLQEWSKKNVTKSP